MIRAEHIHFSYLPGKKNEQLSDICLTVKRGEYLVILGRNGSGKSTLLRQLAGLFPVQQGTLEIAGMDAKKMENQCAIRKCCGMVFQNPDNQFVSSVVEEDLRFGPDNFGIPEVEIPFRIRDSLKKVDMEGFEKRSTHLLSGGQKQRIALAGVLAVSPEILFMDEVTTMLDGEGKTAVREIVGRLHREGKTILYVTHDLREVPEADRVILMDGGKIIAEGTPEEILCDGEKLKRAGMISQSEYVGADEKRHLESEFTACEKENDSGEILLQAEHLSHVYAGGTSLERRALADISLTIRSGEFIGITGKTGCGKSTLIQILAGLFTPEKGEVLFRRKNIFDRRFDSRLLRKALGIVFQFPEYQLFEKTVEKDVGFGLDYLGFDREQRERAVREALEKVGFSYEEIRMRIPATLSGGEKRRVAIAGALAKHPEILIFDEPVAGLDPCGRDEFFRMLRQYCREGITVIVISHDTDYLMRYTGRMIYMADGKIEYDGGRVEFVKWCQEKKETRR